MTRGHQPLVSCSYLHDMPMPPRLGDYSLRIKTLADNDLFGRLSSRSPRKRSQRKHRLSTSVKRCILPWPILPFSARNDTHHVVG
jgi:hypothetical protein